MLPVTCAMKKQRKQLFFVQTLWMDLEKLPGMLGQGILWLTGTKVASGALGLWLSDELMNSGSACLKFFNDTIQGHHRIITFLIWLMATVRKEEKIVTKDRCLEVNFC